MKKKFIFTIVMVVLSFLICFGILEIYFRFIKPFDQQFIKIGQAIYPVGITSDRHFTFDPQAGYTLIPNIHDQEQKITTDNNGFRTTGKEIDPAKKSIIFTGDSTVFGYGVKDEATFSYLIAHDKRLDGYNVINMGVPSYALANILEVVKNKAVKFNPEIIFVSVTWPWMPFAQYEHAEERWKRIDIDFYRKMMPVRETFDDGMSWKKKLVPKTFRALRQGFYKLKYGKQIKQNMTRPTPKDFSLSKEAEIQYAKEAIEVLQETKRTLEEQGIKVVFYVHPFSYTIFHEEYKHLGESSRNLIIKEVPALYTGPFSKAAFEKDKEPLYIDGSHLSEAGNAVYREFFIQYLKSQNIIEK